MSKPWCQYHTPENGRKPYRASYRVSNLDAFPSRDPVDVCGFCLHGEIQKRLKTWTRVLVEVPHA